MVWAGYGRDALGLLRRVAARQWRNELASVVRLVEGILEYTDSPRDYIARLDTRFDAMAGVPYLDMRTLVIARLLALNSRRKVREALSAKSRKWLTAPWSPNGTRLSTFDRRMVKRLLP